MPIPVAVPVAIGVASFLKWLSDSKSNSDATSAQKEALDSAMAAIKGGADKAIGLQQPYLQNAGADYNRQRGLVQGGYYQTPYGQSFKPQQQQPQGFSFNPGQGGASFRPTPGLLNGFTPQGLPSQAGYNTPPPAPPAAPGGQGPMQPPPANPQQVYNHAQQGMPTGPLPTTPSGPPGTGGLMNRNPQTGQGTPTVGGYNSPTADPSQVLAALKMKYPQLFGRSGPLEGGMPRGGLLGGL